MYMLALCCCLCWGARPAEAAFEQDKANKPTIMLCEVNGYGENVLRQEFFATFKEMLQEKLQKNPKFSLVFQQMLPARLPDGSEAGLDAYFSELHKYAIISGQKFDKEQACIELVQFHEQHPVKQAAADTYALHGDYKSSLQGIAAGHGAQYLLFCNMKNVDIKLKTHSVTPNYQDLKGMKIMADVDYYLINGATGAVYEGSTFTDKTTQVFNLLLARYGKTFDVQQLVACVLETLAERVADDVSGKGLGKIKK